MTLELPALSLAAVPGRRRHTLELATEIERRGFAGIYCPSFGDAMGLCHALAIVTEAIPFGTSIVNIYSRSVSDYAQSAAFIHETSGGRFRFGIGVSHAPMNDRLGLTAGKPLADMQAFVETLRSTARIGEIPPIVVAALRERMVGLAADIGDGVTFANVARSHVGATLEGMRDSANVAESFEVWNMIPTCVSDDVAAAAAVNRRTLTMYVGLPNYRNYWKQAGYVEEMEAIEGALAAGNHEAVPDLMSDQWLRDVTLFGPADQVREGLAAWYEAGVTTPILVPSSAQGGQMRAFEELFAIF